MNVARRLGTGFVIASLAFGAYVMLADYVNLRQTRDLARPASMESLPLPQPWGGYAWRAISRTSGDSFGFDPALAAESILEAATRYPLDATQWLDLARIRVEAQEPDLSAVERSLEKAHSTQPLNRRSLWRTAQIALRSGDPETAERQLRRWLEMYPRDTGRALFIGRRWIDSADDLLARMLPPGREFLEESMAVASRRGDTELAEAVWNRLHPKPGLDDQGFLTYIELLLKTGNSDRAVALWADRDPEFTGRGIANGSFARDFGKPMGLNWNTRSTPGGVRIERDHRNAFSEPAALRIDFNGKENVYLTAPSILIPVTPGRTYRLTGVWRADSLTTRSLPYFLLYSPGTDLARRVRVPLGNFGWERWETTFTAPEETQTVVLTLRRDRTNAFDRNIDGTLWIDDLQLEASEAIARVADSE